MIARTERTLRNGAESATKRLAEKINPFDRKINMNDVSDTGMESVRLGYRSVKKTGEVVQTVTNTAKAAKGAAETTYKTVKTTVKVTAYVAKFIGTVWEHAIAATLNPIIWIIAVIIVFIIFECFGIILITQGYTEKTYDAYVSAKGLGKVDDEYSHGQELYKAAQDVKRNEFYDIINGSGSLAYGYYITPTGQAYPYEDKEKSDLLYMSKTYATPSGTYESSSYGVFWATDQAKTVLVNQWNLSVEEYQALAISYVYLQKQQNADEETIMDIYSVKFSEELMNTIIENSVKYVVSKTPNCGCPGENCRHRSSGGYFCTHLHTLYSIAVTFYSKDDVMDKLGFSQKEKEWESITEVYFKNKYYHATPVPTPELEAGG